MWDNVMVNNRRWARMFLISGTYSAVLTVSFGLAYMLRFDFVIPQEEQAKLLTTAMWIVPLELMVLVAVGQCAGLLSYFSIPDLWRLFFGLAIPSALVLGYWQLCHGVQLPPRSVLVGNFIIALGGLATSRLAFRFIRERYFSLHGRPQSKPRRVGIIGAGDVGAVLSRELMRKKGLGMQPVAFFDDDQGKWHSHVHGVPVRGAPEILLEDGAGLNLDEIVIAMPSAPPKRIKEIVKLLQDLGYKFTTVPSLDQLATGRVSVSQLRPVEIEDLLGREPVKLEKENIEQYLKGRVVMVTGAGGSIGSELCRQVAEFKPSRLLLLDQSEVQLFQIEQELIEGGKGQMIKALVGDIVDPSRIRQIFKQHRPQVVVHAAAHKHVPMMEHQPSEAIMNNTFGTMELSQAAMEYQAERFIMISTDKAVNPTSVMGATKRMAELFVQALHASRQNSTRLMAVRFGNVLGSSGSVIPMFKRQIAAGGPVKVTHPDITRYFMTIPEAVSLVLQSGAIGNGGEIFVLDMGNPIKIADLAIQLIVLSGFKPGEDVEIQYVGLRPGEKLYEELQQHRENLIPTNHPKIMRFICEAQPLAQIAEKLHRLHQCVYELEPQQLKLKIKAIVPEYTPFFEAHPDLPCHPVKASANGAGRAKPSLHLTPSLTGMQG